MNNQIILSIQLATKGFQDSIALVKTELTNLNASFTANNNTVTANNEATKTYSSILVQTATDIKTNTNAIAQNTSGIQQQKLAIDQNLTSLKEQKQNIQIVIDNLKQENTERKNTITALDLQNKAITGKGTSDKEEKQNILAKIVALKTENLENNESIATANKSKIVTQEKINLAQKEVAVIKELVTEKALADKQNAVNSNKSTSDQLAFAKRNQQELSDLINNDIKKAQSNQKVANAQELEEGKVARKILEQIDQQDYQKKLAFVKQVNQEIKEGLKDGYNSAVSSQKTNITSQTPSSIGLSANQKEQIRDIENLTNALKLQKNEIQTDINAHVSLKNSIKGTSEEELKLKSNIDTSITGLKNQRIALEESINELNRKKLAIQNNHAALNEHNSSIGQHVNNLQGQTHALNESSKATDFMSIKTVALGNFLANELSAGFHMALGAAEQFSEKSFEDFLKFEDGIHELKGIIGDGIKDVDSFKKDLIDLSFNLGQNVENDARFIKKVLTSGVVDKQDIEDLKKQLNKPLLDVAEAKIEASKEIYEKAAKFSIASKAPIDDVIKAIITIKSNYKVPLEDIDALLNKLKVFGTQSKFELAEVIPQLGALSSAGIKAGRTLEEVLTSFATVGNGLETAPIAKTAVVNLMKKLTMPTATVKAEGALNGLDLSIKGMNDAGGLLGQLEKIKVVVMSLKDEAKRADFANTLFGGDQRAGTGFIQIINNLDKFKEVNNEVLNDTTKFKNLYEERIKSIEVRWQTFKNTLTDSMISFYDGNKDSINNLLELFKNFVNQMAGYGSSFLEWAKTYGEKISFITDKDSPMVQGIQFVIWLLGNVLKTSFVVIGDMINLFTDLSHVIVNSLDIIILKLSRFIDTFIQAPHLIAQGLKQGNLNGIYEFFDNYNKIIENKQEELKQSLLKSGKDVKDIIVDGFKGVTGSSEETAPKIIATTKPEGTVKVGKKGKTTSAPSAFSGDTSDGSSTGNAEAVEKESKILKKFHEDSIKSHEEYIKARDGQNAYNIEKIKEGYKKELEDAKLALKAHEITQKQYDNAKYEYTKNKNAQIADEQDKQNKKIIADNKSANDKYISDIKNKHQADILSTQAKINDIQSKDQLSKTDQLKQINVKEKHLQDIYNQEQKAFTVGSIAYEEAEKHRSESQKRVIKNNQEIIKLDYAQRLQIADNAIKHFENLEDQSDATKLKSVKQALENKKKILNEKANNGAISLEDRLTAKSGSEDVTKELQTKQKEYNKKSIADKLTAEQELTEKIKAATNRRITDENLTEKKSIEAHIFDKKEELKRLNDLYAEADRNRKNNKKATQTQSSKDVEKVYSKSKNEGTNLDTSLKKQIKIDDKQEIENQYTASLKALKRENELTELSFKIKKLSLEDYEKACIDSINHQIEIEQNHLDTIDKSANDYLKKKEEIDEKIKDLQTNQLLKEIDISNRIKELNKSNALEITNAFSSAIETILPGFSKVFDILIGKNEDLQNSLLKNLGLFKELPKVSEGIAGASVGGSILEQTASIGSKTSKLDLSGYSKEFKDFALPNIADTGASKAMKDFGLEIGLTKKEMKSFNSEIAKTDNKSEDDKKADKEKSEKARVESIGMAIKMGAEEVQKSVTAIIENTAKQSVNVTKYSQAVKSFGVNSKEASAANQELNESFSDNLKALPGIGQALSVVGRAFTDFFKITKSQTDKKNESDELSATQNFTKTLIDIKKDSTNKSVELANNEYTNSLDLLSKKGESELAFNIDSLNLALKLASDIDKINQKAAQETMALQNEVLDNQIAVFDKIEDKTLQSTINFAKKLGDDLARAKALNYTPEQTNDLINSDVAREGNNEQKLRNDENKKNYQAGHDLRKAELEGQQQSYQQKKDLIENDMALDSAYLEIEFMNRDKNIDSEQRYQAKKAQLKAQYALKDRELGFNNFKEELDNQSNAEKANIELMADGASKQIALANNTFNTAKQILDKQHEYGLISESKYLSDVSILNSNYSKTIVQLNQDSYNRQLKIIEDFHAVETQKIQSKYDSNLQIIRDYYDNVDKLKRSREEDQELKKTHTKALNEKVKEVQGGLDQGFFDDNHKQHKSNDAAALSEIDDNYNSGDISLKEKDSRTQTLSAKSIIYWRAEAKRYQHADADTKAEIAGYLSSATNLFTSSFDSQSEGMNKDVANAKSDNKKLEPKLAAANKELDDVKLKLDKIFKDPDGNFAKTLTNSIDILKDYAAKPLSELGSSLFNSVKQAIKDDAKAQNAEKNLHNTSNISVPNTTGVSNAVNGSNTNTSPTTNNNPTANLDNGSGINIPVGNLGTIHIPTPTAPTAQPTNNSTSINDNQSTVSDAFRQKILDTTYKQMGASEYEKVWHMDRSQLPEYAANHNISMYANGGVSQAGKINIFGEAGTEMALTQSDAMGVGGNTTQMNNLYKQIINPNTAKYIEAMMQFTKPINTPYQSSSYSTQGGNSSHYHSNDNSVSTVNVYGVPVNTATDIKSSIKDHLNQLKMKSSNQK